LTPLAAAAAAGAAASARRASSPAQPAAALSASASLLVAELPGPAECEWLTLFPRRALAAHSRDQGDFTRNT
jgi:hypothetical protein